MTFSWYVIYVNPRSEFKVAKRLTKSGVEVYFPTVKELRFWSDRKKMIERPLFTSYVFLKIDDSQYEYIRRTKGVVNFIYYNGKPAKIKEREIDIIKEFLSKAEQSSIYFEPYEEVLIKYGPFTGKKGIVESVGKNDLRLILSELKVSIRAKVNKCYVAKG